MRSFYHFFLNSFILTEVITVQNPMLSETGAKFTKFSATKTNKTSQRCLNQNGSKAEKCLRKINTNLFVVLPENSLFSFDVIFFLFAKICYG